LLLLKQAVFAFERYELAHCNSCTSPVRISGGFMRLLTITFFPFKPDPTLTNTGQIDPTWSFTGVNGTKGLGMPMLGWLLLGYNALTTVDGIGCCGDFPRFKTFKDFGGNVQCSLLDQTSCLN
jgi:hypothetical protein